VEPGESLAIRVGEVFTPAAPIDKKALFAGRTKQLRQVVDAINQRGQHAIIFGERGVGKTSLANVLSENLSLPGGNFLMPHVNCDTEDDFTSLWKKILNEISLYRHSQQPGYEGGTLVRPIPLLENLEEPFSTGDIRRVLSPLAANFVVVITLDEFDRLPGGAVRSMMADTIKMI
jgi:Cdc6-like AAA superfamily ATPase